MAQVKVTTIVATALFLYAAGTIADAGYMFSMATVVISLPFVSVAMAWLSLRHLRVERIVPAQAWVHQPAPMKLRVCASDPLPRLVLDVEEATNWIVGPEPGATVFSIPARETVEVAYEVTPTRRGVFELRSVVIGSHDPLGLVTLHRRVPALGTLVAYPVPERLSDTVFSGAERNDFEEAVSTRTRGGGMEPDGVRPYVPGDPLRRMHWKTVARTGRLHVIEFEDAGSLSARIILDCFKGGVAGDEPYTSFEYMIRAAASLAGEAARIGSIVELVCTQPTGLEGGPGRGPAHLRNLLDALAHVEAKAEVRLASVLPDLCGAVQRSTTVFIVTADADPALADAVGLFRATVSRVVVVWADRRIWVQDASVSTSRAEAAYTDDDFIGDLMARGAEVRYLDWSDDNHLLLEEVSYDSD